MPYRTDGQNDLPVSQDQEIDRLCSQYEQAWRAGQQPKIEDYLERVASPVRDSLLKELIATEVDLRREAGEDVQAEEYYRQFPDHRVIVEAAWVLIAERAHDNDEPPSTINQSQAPDLDTGSNEVEDDQDGPPPVPASIGRYQIREVLGEGGFGRVYLAFDTDLGRQVALKVPGRKRLSSASSVEAFLHEARTAAQLKHPGLVVVHDVQRDGDNVYIVQEYIDGQDLARWARTKSPSVEQIVSLLAEVVEAVGFAHQHDLVHRDLKPANLLVDQQGHPHVADFGLAVNESAQRLRKGEVCGTPAYMSPEQVRGLSHVLDGRSDLWSIGVILYELLTGRRPFRGHSMAEIFEDVKRRDPKPLRQIRPEVSGELERICLKCLEKRQTDRYASAAELLDDLTAWLQSAKAAPITPQNHDFADAGEQPAGSTAAVGDTESDKSSMPRVVPKGLRSFDEHDADFFLELLPGPRDRNGLPESIRFWKQRIEETDPEKTFRVGLIYGPSGCGKSSLVKAGLLPRLASHIVPVYLEATPEDTELRLLKGLRRRFSTVPVDLSLPDALAGIREGLWVTDNTKVCVVLDQFEQWLHAGHGEQDTQLVQALRHCDGARLQAVVLVRDDFWMPATRFLSDLDIRQVERENSVPVDLFDPPHARKVLTAFGRAYGRLPEGAVELSAEQEHFLDRAVDGLAQDGMIICVRLALFADMLKGKAWTPATLKAVGGSEGLGVTFLEETFSAPSAPAAHRHHQRAAQAVLKALLPESGSDIKGSRQSYEQLLDASGCTQRQEQFGELMRILDSEIRLITPTVPEGEDADAYLSTESSESPDTTEEADDQRNKYYQLTHDYLVPSLREWLTRKQKETRRGRAELRLTDRAALWNAKPEPRHLPSLWEYGTIRLLTDHHQWTEQQRTMMARATRVHGVRSFAATLLIILTLIVGYGTYGWIRGDEAVKTLLNADAQSVAKAAERAASYRFWTADDLKEVVQSNPVTRADRRRQLHARLALLHIDTGQIEPLLQELLTIGDTAYVGVIRQSLLDVNAPIAEECWSLLHNPDKPDAQRFRAGVVLAGLQPQSDLWVTEDFQLLVDQLVAINAVYQPDFWPLLTDVSNRMLEPLQTVFGDRERPETEQIAAANAIARFAPQKAALLGRLLLSASGPQYRILYDAYKETANDASKNHLLDLAGKQPAEELDPVQRVAFGKNRAAAAITLLRQGEQEAIMDALRYETDPETLTQFVHRCRARGVTPQRLIGCLEEVDRRRGPLDGQRQKTDDSVMYALLLSLGEFTWDELPAQRDALVKRLGDIYEKDPSSGVHSATGWLLRHWGHDQLVARVDQLELPYDESGHREWYVQKIRYRPSGVLKLLAGPREFYLTFIVFLPGSFTMGSPEDEPNREICEAQHQVILTRPIAVCDREVSWGHWDAFYGTRRRQAYSEGLPKTIKDGDSVFGVEWFDAVKYCLWLSARVGLSEVEQCYIDPASLPNDGDRDPANWQLLLDKPGFRLLTEAEWEYICRSGTSTAYSFGGDEEMLDHYAWYMKNSARWSHQSSELRPNPRGLFDTHGNVLEWCHDRYVDELTTATDPRGAEVGRDRVYRGGCWEGPAQYCRSSVRRKLEPTSRNIYLGFRLAASLPAAESRQTGEARGTRKESR